MAHTLFQTRLGRVGLWAQLWDPKAPGSCSSGPTQHERRRGFLPWAPRVAPSLKKLRVCVPRLQGHGQGLTVRGCATSWNQGHGLLTPAVPRFLGLKGFFNVERLCGASKSPFAPSPHQAGATGRGGIILTLPAH